MTLQGCVANVKAEAEFARQIRYSWFCYYHYWFNGKRLLERPFEEVCSSGEPDFLYAFLGQRNLESRRWFGEEQEVPTGRRLR